jgi:RNA polymerase sigma factor (sigma-70 family)
MAGEIKRAALRIRRRVAGIANSGNKKGGSAVYREERSEPSEKSDTRFELRSFEGRSAFSTWLTRIVINHALMIRRGKNGHPELLLDEILETRSNLWPCGIVDRADPEKLSVIKEVRELFEEQVRLLPPKLRAAFQLDVDGRTAAESVRALGIRESAFKSRLLRARRRLTSVLQQSLQRPASTVATVGRI